MLEYLNKPLEELQELYVEKAIIGTLLQEIQEHEEEFGIIENLQLASNQMQIKLKLLEQKETKLVKTMNPGACTHTDVEKRFRDLEEEIKKLRETNQSLQDKLIT